MPGKAALDPAEMWIVLPLLKADHFVLDVALWLDFQLNDLSQRHAGPNLVERRWLDLSGHLGRNVVGQPIRGLASLLRLAGNDTE